MATLSECVSKFIWIYLFELVGWDSRNQTIKGWGRTAFWLLHIEAVVRQCIGVLEMSEESCETENQHITDMELPAHHLHIYRYSISLDIIFVTDTIIIINIWHGIWLWLYDRTIYSVHTQFIFAFIFLQLRINMFIHFCHNLSAEVN